MDKFNATAAFARIEQRLLFRPFTSAYPTCVRLFRTAWFALYIPIESWVIHDIWLSIETRNCLHVPLWFGRIHAE